MLQPTVLYCLHPLPDPDCVSKCLRWCECHSGRSADVDYRDDLHDRGAAEIHRTQHLPRNILVLLSGKPRHLQ